MKSVRTRILSLVTLARHDHSAITQGYGHVQPGFAPATLRRMLRRAGLEVEQAAPADDDVEPESEKHVDGDVERHAPDVAAVGGDRHKAEQGDECCEPRPPRDDAETRLECSAPPASPRSVVAVPSDYVRDSVISAFGVSPDRVMVVAGASAGFTLAFLTLFEQGNRTIFGRALDSQPSHANALARQAIRLKASKSGRGLRSKIVAGSP